MPHFYAIAIYRLDDYNAAAIPVLPAKRGITITKQHIIGYIVAFLVASMALTFQGYTGYRYMVVALVAGLIWLWFAFAGYNKPDERHWARKLFACSIVVIVVMNVMMSIDFVTPASIPNNIDYASQTIADSASLSH